jgi:hypothetical protein
LTGAQSDEVLVAAPGTGARICVTDIAINSSADATATLEHGSTTILTMPVKADIPFVISLNTPLMCANNAALTLTTSAGNASINISGYILS